MRTAEIAHRVGHDADAQHERADEHAIRWRSASAPSIVRPCKRLGASGPRVVVVREHGVDAFGLGPLGRLDHGARVSRELRQGDSDTHVETLRGGRMRLAMEPGAPTALGGAEKDDAGPRGAGVPRGPACVLQRERRACSRLTPITKLSSEIGRGRSRRRRSRRPARRASPGGSASPDGADRPRPGR